MKKYLLLFLFSLIYFNYNFAVNPDQAVIADIDKKQENNLENNVQNIQDNFLEKIKEQEKIKNELKKLSEQIKSLTPIEIRLIQDKPSSPAAKESKNKVVKILKQIGSVYGDIVNIGDKLTTKKALIGLIIVVGPFATLMGTSNLTTKLISFIANKFSKSVVKGSSTVIGEVINGVANGTKEIAKEHPIATGALLIYYFRDYIIKYGPKAVYFMGNKLLELITPNFGYIGV